MNYENIGFLCCFALEDFSSLSSGRTTFSEVSLHVRAYFSPHLETAQLWFSQQGRLVWSAWTFSSFSGKKSPIHLKIGHPEMIAFKIYGKFILLLCQLVIRWVNPSWLLHQFQLGLKCCTAVSGRNLKSMLYGNANAWGTRHSVMIQIWICSGQRGKYYKIHFGDFNEFLPSTFMILVTSLRSYCTWLVK